MIFKIAKSPELIGGEMKLGFIGLGKMGSRMVTKLLMENHEIVVWNRSPGPYEDLLADYQKINGSRQGRLSIAESLADVVQELARPRVIWLMLPAGAAIETVSGNLAGLLEPDDILIDGGNSHYKDTEKRFKIFRERKIKFLGIGVSGGIIAEKEGYPLMVGGDKSAYEFIEPVLISLAKPHGGYDYFGNEGAGHFVKMVHNGMEYGIMQSLGEGFEVLHEAPYQFNLAQIARLYQKGTLVSGFMLDRLVEVLDKSPDLADVKGTIAESGEALWTVDQAKEEGVEVDIIQRSLEYRRKSLSNEKIQNSFTAKLIAALRNAFGGHEIQKK
jgi:6-phosphogluconate dehydrogenase